jgi:hypothetical protein
MNASLTKQKNLLMKKFYLVMGLIASLVFTAIAQDPKAYYPLNGNADDASGNGLHGVITNAVPTTDKDNNSDAAMMFNGSSNIKVADTSAFSYGVRAAFTISAWFKTDAISFYSTIASTGTAAWQKGFLLGLNWESGKIMFAIGAAGFFNASSCISMVSTKDYNDGMWHFVAASIDPATNKAFMYVDGRLEAIKYFGNFGATGGVLSADSLELDITGVNYSLFCTEPQLMIGTTSSSQNFNGAIDEIRIYDQALSLSQLNSLYSGMPSYIAEELNQSGLLLFPNPTLGAFTLSYTETIEEVQIFDLQGKLIYYSNPYSNSVQFDENLISGMYLVKIKTKQREEIKRLLVK